MKYFVIIATVYSVILVIMHTVKLQSLQEEHAILLESQDSLKQVCDSLQNQIDFIVE